MTEKEYLSILNQIALNYDAEYVNECHDDFCISMRNNIKQIENLIKEHFDPEPYKFEDLKEGMWVWDDKDKKCKEICEVFKWKGYEEWVSFETNSDCDDITLFEEHRFYPVTKAIQEEVKKDE